MRIVPLKMLMELSGQRSVFPFYHLVADEEVIHVKHLYRMRSTREFVSDLEFFLKELKPLDPLELIADYSRGIVHKKPGFLLTFDDGLRQFNDIIAPVLLRKGIPAICFLNSDFIDNKDLFFRYKTSILFERLITDRTSGIFKSGIKELCSEKGIHFDEDYKFLFLIKYSQKQFLDEVASILDIDFQDYLKKYIPYMDTKQVENLVKQGFLFGSHSLDHPQYADLPEDQQILQTALSMDEIASRFKLDYRLFSFPFTDFGISRHFFDTIFSNDKKIVDLSFGCAGLKKDDCIKNIQRIPIEVENFSAQEIIYGEYWYYLFKMLINKNIIKRF